MMLSKANLSLAHGLQGANLILSPKASKAAEQTKSPTIRDEEENTEDNTRMEES